MKGAALVRTLVGLLVLALFGWVIYNTRWEEVEIDDPARGAAATDEYYSLRHVLESASATLEVRTALEPMRHTRLPIRPTLKFGSLKSESLKSGMLRCFACGI